MQHLPFNLLFFFVKHLTFWKLKYASCRVNISVDLLAEYACGITNFHVWFEEISESVIPTVIVNNSYS